MGGEFVVYVIGSVLREGDGIAVVFHFAALLSQITIFSPFPYILSIVNRSRIAYLRARSASPPSERFYRGQGAGLCEAFCHAKGHIIRHRCKHHSKKRQMRHVVMAIATRHDANRDTSRWQLRRVAPHPNPLFKGQRSQILVSLPLIEPEIPTKPKLQIVSKNIALQCTVSHPHPSVQNIPHRELRTMLIICEKDYGQIFPPHIYYF